MRWSECATVLVAATMAAVAQSVLAPSLAIGGAVPDFPAAVAAMFAAGLSPSRAFVAGWFIGAARDAVASAPPGGWAMGHASGAAVAAIFFSLAGRDAALPRATAGFASALLAHSVALVYLVLATQSLPSIEMAGDAILAAVYTAPLVPMAILAFAPRPARRRPPCRRRAIGLPARCTGSA